MLDQKQNERTDQMNEQAPEFIDTTIALKLTNDQVYHLIKIYRDMIEHQENLFNDDQDYYLSDNDYDSADLNWHLFQGSLISRKGFTINALYDMAESKTPFMSVSDYVMFKHDLMFVLTEWALVSSFMIREYDDPYNPLKDNDWNDAVDEYVMTRDLIKKIEQAL